MLNPECEAWLLKLELLQQQEQTKEKKGQRAQKV